MKKDIIKSDGLFFLIIFLSVIVLFKTAFSIHFFSDDFAFLNISHPHSIGDFLYFFVPGKNYFYRPIPSELFYSILNFFGQNYVLGHTLVFICFFIGIYFFYKSLIKITKNVLFGRVAIVLYALHFTHVFQLYQLATFQEVAMFTFLAISFYSFISNRFAISIGFFILALMSKETSLFFPLFIALYMIAFKKYKQRSMVMITSIFFIISAISLLVYKSSLSQVAQIDIYRIQLTNFRLILNNGMWYFFWSLGFPSILPNFFTSIFKPPNNDFWNLFKDQVFFNYFSSLSLYSIILFIGSILFLFIHKHNKTRYFFWVLIFNLISFTIFLIPAFPIIHKWMVRLTIPVMFIVLIQAYMLQLFIKGNTFWKIISVSLLLSYISWNFFGMKNHEGTSLYLTEDHIVTKAQKYFSSHEKEIRQHRYVYFKDDAANKNLELMNSKKLYTSLSDQSFIGYYFPQTQLKALYNFKDDTIPSDSFIIHSSDLL